MKCANCGSPCALDTIWVSVPEWTPALANWTFIEQIHTVRGQLYPRARYFYAKHDFCCAACATAVLGPLLYG